MILLRKYCGYGVAAIAILAVSTCASPLPDPQGRGSISVFRTGNGVAAGSTYSSGSGYSGVGTSVYGDGPGGYTVTSFNGGPGQVYFFGNGGGLRSGVGGGTYYSTRNNPGVTFHRFGSGSVFPRTSFFPGFGVGTGAYAGGGTGAYAGAGGAFASAGGIGAFAGK
ncbi:hypothetical protein SK128_002176 [Halocaridina rubra]|uniref:Lipoprotein n=1 Tax=Halocaridina rubra TaxID=373956 RepID=A0AAN9AHT1_HALRR